MKFLGGFTIWFVVNYLHRNQRAVADMTGLPDLLRPQFNYQIALRAQEHYYFAVPKLPPALSVAINLLLSEQTPFRLFYNFTRTKVEPRVSRPPRFTQNLVVWLVFVSVQRKSEALDVYEVLRSCLLGLNFGYSAAVHNDFVQVVVDESALAGSWDGTCHFNIFRAYVPLYFVIIPWSGTRFQSLDAVLLAETCRYDCGSGFPFHSQTERIKWNGKHFERDSIGETGF